MYVFLKYIRIASIFRWCSVLLLESQSRQNVVIIQPHTDLFIRRLLSGRQAHRILYLFEYMSLFFYI